MLKDTEQRNTQGIGLGLAISQNIVQHFGGLIEVESEVGQGSKFSFQIEVQKVELAVTSHL